METKDPALTKTRITDTNTNINRTNSHNEIEDHNAEHKGPETLQETVIGSEYLDDDDSGIEGNNTITEDHNAEHKSTETLQETVVGSEPVDDNDIEDHTTINKGTDTFKEGVINSEHVNDDDNSARQPDPRDQQGETPFDEGINGDSVSSEAPDSEGITDMNRYASIDNAQTRILSPDEKD